MTGVSGGGRMGIMTMKAKRVGDNEREKSGGWAGFGGRWQWLESMADSG